MDTKITAKNYEKFKAELDSEMTKAAESFVRIGYLLKIARDTDVLTESGYANLAEFAEAEYHLDKSQVSRFISINDRYSENGYGEQLEERYRGYGYTKLAMMLTLPENIAEEISPAYSKAEIQAIKDEVAAEQAVSPMEVYLEGEDERQAALPNSLLKALRQLGHDEPEIYKRLLETNCPRSALAPSGNAIHSVRIQGIGRLMIAVKESEKHISVINVRTGEKETYTDEDLKAAAEKLIHGKNAEESYEEEYGEPYPALPAPEPEKPGVAPVQQPGDTKKPPKKESKVTKARPRGTKPQGTAKTPGKLKAPGAQPEPAAEPLEGQAVIEDYKEVLPEENGATVPENGSIIPENGSIMPESTSPAAALLEDPSPPAPENPLKPEEPAAPVPAGPAGDPENVAPGAAECGDASASIDDPSGVDEQELKMTILNKANFIRLNTESYMKSSIPAVAAKTILAAAVSLKCYAEELVRMAGAEENNEQIHP